MFNQKCISMKKVLLLFFLITCSIPWVVAVEKSGTVHVGADVVSSYLWRGSKFGNGPAFQPVLEYSYGGFTAGAWGSYGFADAFSEADLYASYRFGFGLSLGLTSYYFPGDPFFKGTSHANELNGGFEAGLVSLSANYMLNEGAGSAGGDLYFEAGLTTGPVEWFIGAGDGWHTPDGKFGICNLGLTGSKEIKISDSFSLPVFTSAILNPKTEQFHIVVGFSL